MPRAVLLGICASTGVILGLLGTVLHGNIWVLGEPDSGWVIPWGAVLGLVMLYLAMLWAGTTAGRVAEPMLMGSAAFTVASIAYIWTGSDQLVVPYSQIAFAALPGPVIASLLWWFGTALVTCAAMITVRMILIYDRARQPAEPVSPGPVD